MDSVNHIHTHMKTKSPTPKEITLLQVKACERFEKICKEHGFPCPERIHLMMNLHYAEKCCPLDYGKFLEFPEFDFLHDMFGIDRHMDKSTCILDPTFLPRCAK